MKTLFAVLACACCVAANAAPPPAPVITVAATDIRQLEFNWEPVSGVQTYELWFRSAEGAAWVKYEERPARLAPLFRIGVPVHLLNWSTADFYVKACNYGGCSSSNVVGVNGERYEAMGYFKPRQAGGVKWFGNNVALSADGYTMAVTASETIGAVRDTLIVHVYRKTTRSSGWRLEARLRPSAFQPDTAQYLSGSNLALSADGNVLALGTDTFGSPDSTSDEHVGTVDVFRRSGATWSHSQSMRGSQELDAFGSVLKMDDAARTLVIYRSYPGTQQEGGTLEVYRAPAGGNQFTHEMSMPPPPRGTNQHIHCNAHTLSGDGDTLVRNCYTNTGNLTYVYTGAGFAQTAVIQSASAIGFWSYDLSYDGTTLLMQDEQGAQVYRLGAGGWQWEAALADGSGTPEPGTRRIAISRDGKIAVVGNHNERTVGRGPLNPPFNTGSAENATGGVMVYEYKPSGWRLRRLVKPGSYNVGYAGMSVALSGNGNILAVAAPLDPSAAAGIDGSRVDASAPERGAVWLY